MPPPPRYRLPACLHGLPACLLQNLLLCPLCLQRFEGRPRPPIGQSASLFLLLLLLPALQVLSSVAGVSDIMDYGVSRALLRVGWEGRSPWMMTTGWNSC